MLKLRFNNLEVVTNGIVTRGKITASIIAIIRNKSIPIQSKTFNTKITLNAEDKFDLNKAYKYIQAKLEKEAYSWALKQMEKQASYNMQYLNALNNFTNKAKYIVNHDDKYLSKF